MTKLTITGVSDQLYRHLACLSRERGEHVNTVVLSILESAFDVDCRRRRLTRYGTWDRAEVAEFDRALAHQRVADK